VYDNKSQLEVLQHSHDVLALAWRPDGKQLASSTLDGQIYFWNAQVGGLYCAIKHPWQLCRMLFCMVYSYASKQPASSTLGGQIYFWSTQARVL
jgi:WD40 repeat protein